MTPAGAPSADLDTSGPDQVFWLSNGRLTLGIVPALGGRLLSLQFGGRELLYRNAELIDHRLHRRDASLRPPVDVTMASWRNYGGDKTWPAPQGWSGPAQWPGPPDPVLDSGPYVPTLTLADDSVTLAMTSAPDRRSGLQITRTVRLRAGSVEYELRQRFEAVDRPVRWAIWDVLQLRAESSGDPRDGWYATVVDSPDSAIELLSGNGFPAHSIADGVMVVPFQEIVGKLGVPGASGRVATWLDGVAVTQRFSVVEGAEYPDRGSRAEIWLECPLPHPLAHLGGLDPPARIIESEVLGPLITLMPGESTSSNVVVGVTTEFVPATWATRPQRRS
ncbi:DUF4380 domain-containing protein [Nakamurella sp. PAMC28650]|uniref:DUF4380 domain-containing protein n=1 Tax=Nakamurella sp. PAMC28650 TaxID=2762325 RepID=UPI00164D814F|nr:DUF4380 domain-containing protein [Nakamurella sp. PAMC28650]QNK82690.1 DUF4380 domain-containing protein [Nakamurella sp. PAMC28650]